MALTKTLLLAGAAATPVGIAVALVIDPAIGGVVVLVGAAAALLGLHRFGRSGVDRSRLS
jgi:hypothetical protein